MENRSTRLMLTTIAVLLATVGPEFGTSAVSGCAITMSSYGSRSVCDAICARIVFVPCPNSVEDTSTAAAGGAHVRAWIGEVAYFGSAWAGRSSAHADNSNRSG